MSKKKKQSNKIKASTSAETSESIALQTQAFLAAGGVVEVVQRGITGRQMPVGRTQIIYADK